VPIYEERAVDLTCSSRARNLATTFRPTASAGRVQAQRTNDKAAIDYLVNPGKRHRLVYIEISGNRCFDRVPCGSMFLEPKSLLQFRHGLWQRFLGGTNIHRNLYRSKLFDSSHPPHRDATAARRTTCRLPQMDEDRVFRQSLQVEGIERLDKAQILGALSSTEGSPSANSTSP
jgi:hypothetical protein